MLAVPFQGYAAAAMAFCAFEAQPQASLAPMSHDHAAMDHGAGDHASQGSDHGAADDLADSTHKCGTCSACSACHAVALTSAAPAAVNQSLPQAELADPSDALTTVARSVPDKPPRA